MLIPANIIAPGMDEQRDLMRASAKKKEGQRHALPPQIFNADKYCGVSSINQLSNDLENVFSRIMMILMWPMKMMNWRNFLVFQERHLR